VLVEIFLRGLTSRREWFFSQAVLIYRWDFKKFSIQILVLLRGPNPHGRLADYIFVCKVSESKTFKLDD